MNKIDMMCITPSTQNCGFAGDAQANVLTVRAHRQSRRESPGFSQGLLVRSSTAKAVPDSRGLPRIKAVLHLRENRFDECRCDGGNEVARV